MKRSPPAGAASASVISTAQTWPWGTEASSSSMVVPARRTCQKSTSRPTFSTSARVTSSDPRGIDSTIDTAAGSRTIRWPRLAAVSPSLRSGSTSGAMSKIGSRKAVPILMNSAPSSSAASSRTSSVRRDASPASPSHHQSVRNSTSTCVIPPASSNRCRSFRVPASRATASSSWVKPMPDHPRSARIPIRSAWVCGLTHVGSRGVTSPRIVQEVATSGCGAMGSCPSEGGGQANRCTSGAQESRSRRVSASGAGSSSRATRSVPASR